MKSRLLFIVSISFFCTIGTVKAQDYTIKLENVVNEQFGTLLESLLKDGKIDEAGAKTYLETVFGYDEAVCNYLQAVNLSQQISNIKQGNLSFDSYMETLGSSLFSLIPESYKQELLKNPNYIGWQLGQEIRGGYISAETLQNTFNFIADDIKKNKKNKLIVEKLKQLTPKIDKLRNTTENKKVVVNDEQNKHNWKLNPQKIKKGFFSNKSTFNKVVFEYGNLVLDPTDGYADKFLNIYKNKEKFDFSKDFKITIKGKLDPYEFQKVEYQASNFSVLIGQYYLFDAYLLYAEKYDQLIDWSAFSVKIPNAEFTTSYGVFNYENLLFFTKGERIKTITTHLNKGYENAGATEKKTLNFNNGFELTIQSKGGYLTYYINGIDCGIQQQITYLPNKFSFDIKANIDRKTIIESVKLEHL